QSDRHAELRGLVEALCEESIAPEQMARLEEILRADPEAEEFYISSILVQSKLLQAFGGALPDLGGKSRGKRAPWRDAAEAEGALKPAVAADGMPPDGRVRRRPWLSRALVAAGCAIALLAGGFAALRWPIEGGNGRGADPAPTTDPASWATR